MRQLVRPVATPVQSELAAVADVHPHVAQAARQAVRLDRPVGERLQAAAILTEERQAVQVAARVGVEVVGGIGGDEPRARRERVVGPKREGELVEVAVFGPSASLAGAVAAGPHAEAARSEERRVGKEWRSARGESPSGEDGKANASAMGG